MPLKPVDKKSPRPARQFTDEFKAGAVRLVVDEGCSCSQVAKDLDVSKSVITRWVSQAKFDASQGAAGSVSPSEREELARLRRENKVLKQERDILKKATAFFAKENR